MCTRINQRVSRCYQIRICKIANVLSGVWSRVNVTCSKRNCFQDSPAWLKGSEAKLDKSAKLDREGIYFSVHSLRLYRIEMTQAHGRKSVNWLNLRAMSKHRFAPAIPAANTCIYAPLSRIRSIKLRVLGRPCEIDV